MVQMDLYDRREGHALAERLSRQSSKATKSLRTTINKYNKLECSTTYSLPL